MGDAIYVTYLVNFLSRDAPASSVPPPTSRKSANDDYEEEEEEEEEGERQNLRAMGTLHIGRIGMRGRARGRARGEDRRRAFKVHRADDGRGRTGRGKTASDKGAGEETRGEERTRRVGYSRISRLDRSIDWSNRPKNSTDSVASQETE